LAHFACVWRRNIEIPTLRKWEHSARQQSSTTTYLKLPIWSATKRLYASGSFEDSDHATLTIWVKENIELHAVCDIFSRLGTVDIDAAKFAA